MVIIAGDGRQKQKGLCLFGQKGFGQALDLLHCALWSSLREEDSLKAPGQPVHNPGIANEPESSTADCNPGNRLPLHEPRDCLQNEERLR